MIPFLFSWVKEKKINFFRAKKVFIPANCDNIQWYLLVIDVEQKTVEVHDFLAQSKYPFQKYLLDFLKVPPPPCPIGSNYW